MGAIIETENLIFSYGQDEGAGEERALNCITVEIEEGSFTAIIGKNGSESPHWLCTMLCLPTEGRVLVAGYDTMMRTSLGCSTDGGNGLPKSSQIVSAVVEDDVAFVRRIGHRTG